jgi:hypothetical protein
MNCEGVRTGPELVGGYPDVIEDPLCDYLFQKLSEALQEVVL